MDNKKKSEQPLHIALLPWLAFGHLIPFHNLAVAIAKAGHRVSFISTPRNIQRLPKIPDHLLSLIAFVNLPLPHVEGLPEQAESTNDMSYEQSHLLKAAYDLLQEPIKYLLVQSSPDWIVHDFASHWCSAISIACGVRTVLFCTFPASVVAFFGPHEVWTVEARKQCWPEPKSLTAKPEWFPFPSKVAFKSHEAQAMYSTFFGINVSGMSDFDRVKLCTEGCDVMAIRSCDEYEGEYLELIGKFHGKPVIPVGLLPPAVMKPEKNAVDDDSWSRAFSWLDEQEPKSVVFVSFGSEYKFSKDEVQELAHGLEQSNLPFLWALRRPTWLDGDIDEALPEGFMDRIKGRGIIEVGWAPQMEILAHPSIGGSLFHCGMGSIVETLRFGHVLILMPMIFDQGLNARLLVEKGVGIEVERNGDGSFSSDEIGRALRTAMVSDEGEALRAKAREMGTMVGDQVLHDNYVKRFAKYLRNAPIQSVTL